MTQPYSILPSLLSADFARLGEEAEAVLKAGGDMLHFDVMDNHYVPNLTVGPLVCQALRDYGISAPIDVHLMVQPVDDLILKFAKAGASHITFHPEASLHVDRSLSLIRDQGLKAGLAFNPGSSWQCIEYLLDKLDIILVMSVNPGFGGQKFIESSLEKIKKIRQFLDASGHSNILLAVDGGITAHNIGAVAKAGANMFVAGSAIFNNKNYQSAISDLREAMQKNN